MNDSSKQGPQIWEKICAFIFGALFLIVILVIAIFIPYPTSFQMLVFRVVLAIAVAGIAAVIPGFLHINIKGTVRAGGAIAVFVFVYWFNPAFYLIAQPRPEHEGYLGNLYNHLNSTPENNFTLNLQSTELIDFMTPLYAGEKWSDVVATLCRDPRNHCLECIPEPNLIQNSVTIKLRNGPDDLKNIGKGDRAIYVCK